MVRNIQEDFKKENNVMGLSYLNNCCKEYVHRVLGLTPTYLHEQGTNYTNTVYSNLTRFDDFVLCLL